MFATPSRPIRRAAQTPAAKTFATGHQKLAFIRGAPRSLCRPLLDKAGGGALRFQGIGRTMHLCQKPLRLLGAISVGTLLFTSGAMPSTAQTTTDDVTSSVSSRDASDPSPVEVSPDPNPESSVNPRDPYGTNERTPSTTSIPDGLSRCVSTKDIFTPRTFRTELGLSSSFDPHSSTEIRYGIRVSPSEATFLDERLKIRSSIDTSAIDAILRGLSPDVYMDSVWDPTEGKMIVYVADADPSQAAATLAATRALSEKMELENVRIVEIESPLSFSELTTLKLELLDAFASSRPGADLSLEVDPSCGIIMAIVQTTDDVSAVAKIASRLGIPAETIVALVSANSTEKNMDRYDYHVQGGGLGLWLKNPNSGVANQCTSSIPFRDAGGTLYAVTAAHCLPSVSATPHFATYSAVDWYQGVLGGVDISAWTGAHYVYGGTLDVTVTAMYGSGASWSMINGGAHTAVAMDWWQSSPSQAKKDDVVCQSGINWGGANCGTILNPLWSGTVEGVSFTSLMSASFVSYGGDSGGTVWSDRSDGRWYIGVVKSSNGTSSRFSHIGYMKPKFTYLSAPVNMF